MRFEIAVLTGAVHPTRRLFTLRKTTAPTVSWPATPDERGKIQGDISYMREY